MRWCAPFLPWRTLRSRNPPPVGTRSPRRGPRYRIHVRSRYGECNSELILHCDSVGKRITERSSRLHVLIQGQEVSALPDYHRNKRMTYIERCLESVCERRAALNDVVPPRIRPRETYFPTKPPLKGDPCPVRPQSVGHTHQSRSRVISAHSPHRARYAPSSSKVPCAMDVRFYSMSGAHPDVG